MTLAYAALMVNRQRALLLPMNCGFPNMLTCDEVLITANHITEFLFSNFWGSCASDLTMPWQIVKAERVSLCRPDTSSFRSLKADTARVR